MSFYEGLIIGLIIGVLAPFGLPALVEWLKKTLLLKEEKV